MLRKVALSLALVVYFINVSFAYADDNKQIEILNIEKDQVIKTIPTNKEIQEEAVKSVKEINGIVKSFKPIPDNGHMIKIPLEPTYYVENKWINAILSEVIVILPEEDDPYLLLFDDENNSYFFTTKTDFNNLLNLLEFSKEGMS